MFTTIITDCKGENEAGRQVARFNSYGLGPTDLVGVDSGLNDTPTIEAAGNLIDLLDAGEGKKGIIIVNVAPRGAKKDGENGTSFSYFYYKNTLIISTIKDHCLSFIKRFEIVKTVRILDVKAVLDHVNKQPRAKSPRFSRKGSKGIIDKKLTNYIVESQFRSFDFVPRVAKWLTIGVNIPSKPYSLDKIPDIPQCIWHIDSFGNAKMTLTLDDLKIESPQFLITSLGTYPFYQRLKDIPYGETAIYIGSSGIGNKRFLEIATQGLKGSAAHSLNLKVGDEIKFM